MKILVIGGNGFLGFNLIKKLNKKNNKITVLDQKIFKLKTLKNLRIVKGNFLNKNVLLRVIKNQDYVFHLAGISDLETARENPMNVIKYNVEGTAKILDLCNKYKIKRFIYASSIYAISEEGGFYRFGKRAAEDYIIEYCKENNLKYSILRYGSIYGPDSPKSNGLRKIIEKAISKKRVVYYGSNKNKRKYIYIDDATSSTIEVLRSNYKNKIVNLTGKKKVGVSQVLRITAKMLKINKKIKYLNKKIIGHYISEPKRLKIRYGKNMYSKNSTNLRIGIRKTINYHKQL